MFCSRGKNARTLQLGRTQENIISTQKRDHSRKPDEQYALIEGCSSGPRFEMFACGPRVGWTVWGNQADDYVPTWDTYANHSQAEVVSLKSRKAV
jgi:N6-adenosine-specific RNA methylase IME4